MILTSCSVVHIVHSTHNGKDGRYKLVCSQMLRLKNKTCIHICTNIHTHTHTHTHKHTHTQIIAMLKTLNSVPTSELVCISPVVAGGRLAVVSFTLPTLHSMYICLCCTVHGLFLSHTQHSLCLMSLTMDLEHYHRLMGHS